MIRLLQFKNQFVMLGLSWLPSCIHLYLLPESCQIRLFLPLYLPYESLLYCTIPFSIFSLQILVNRAVAFFIRCWNHSRIVLFLSSLFVKKLLLNRTVPLFCSVTYGYLHCCGSGSGGSVNNDNWPPKSGFLNSEL